MIIQITDKCNRGCTHCLIDCKSTNTNFMKLEDFKYIIDRISGKTLNILISGGEPFLHPDIVEMVQYAVDKTPAIVSVLTSGMGVDVIRHVKLDKPDRLVVQITEDPRYYPSLPANTFQIKKFMEDESIKFSKHFFDEISHIRSIGRAKKNGLKNTNIKFAGCANSILQLIQADKINSLDDWLMLENVIFKVCMSMVDYNLDFYLGECKLLKICNLKNDDFSMMINYFKHNINALTCEECGFNNIEQVRAKMLEHGIIV